MRTITINILTNLIILLIAAILAIIVNRAAFTIILCLAAIVAIVSIQRYNRRAAAREHARYEYANEGNIARSSAFLEGLRRCKTMSDFWEFYQREKHVNRNRKVYRGKEPPTQDKKPPA